MNEGGVLVGKYGLTANPRGDYNGSAIRRREFCHCADTPSPSVLKHQLEVEGGAAE